MKTSGLDVHLFGGPHLWRNGVLVALSPLEGALLGIVAASEPTGVEGEQLRNLLWSRGTDRQRAHRLSQLTYSLHSRLDGERIIFSQGRRLRLNRSLVRTDFEEVTDQAVARIPQLALQFGRGFLRGLASVAGADLDAWIAQRERELRSGLEAHAAQFLAKARASADWSSAEQAALALCRLCPYDDTYRCELLLAAAMRNSPSEALDLYRTFQSEVSTDARANSEKAQRMVERLAELRSGALTSGHGLRDPLAPDRLYGRELELGVLTSCLGNKVRSRVTSIHVLGDGGIGKTRLVEEALGQLAILGAETITMRGFATEGSKDLEAVLRGFPSEWTTLRELIAQARLRMQDPSSESGDDPVGALAQGLTSWLHRAGSGRPVVLFVDDFQWLDQRSVDTLSRVRTAWTDSRLVVIIACQTSSARGMDNLRCWMADSVRLGEATTLELRPLDDAEVRSCLLDLGRNSGRVSCPPDSDDEWIGMVVSLSRGRPGIALQALESRHAQAPGIHRPDPVRALVHGETNGLSGLARQFVHLLAVSGDAIPLSTLAQALEITEEVAESAFGEGVSSGLLRAAADGIECRDRSFGMAIRSALSADQLVAGHRAIAKGLIQTRNAGAALRIAHHLLAAGEPGEAEAYVLRGARQAIDRGQWSDARLLLEKALGASFRDSTVASFSALLASVVMLLGEFDRACAHWSHAALCHARAGDPTEALNCRIEGMRARFLSGDAERDGLLGDIRRIRAECADLGIPGLAARAMDLEVRLLDALRRTKDVPFLAAEALDKARRYPPPASLTFLSVAMVDAVYGAPSRAALSAEEAFSQAALIGDAEAALDALNWWVIALYHKAELNLPENKALVARALDIASHSRRLEQRFKLHANIGVWFTESGDYAAAERALDRAAEVLGMLPAPHLRRNLLLARGQLDLEVKDFGAARERFSNALALSVVTGEPARCVATAGLGLAMLYTGQIREARAALDSLPDFPDQWTYDPLLWLCLRARLLSMEGRLPEVEAELRRQEAILESSDKTAWMRVQLFRLGALKRWGKELDQAEVESLRRFLVDRNIGSRTKELEGIASKRHRGAFYGADANALTPRTGVPDAAIAGSPRGTRSRSSTYS